MELIFQSGFDLQNETLTHQTINKKMSKLVEKQEKKY